MIILHQGQLQRVVGPGTTAGIADHAQATYRLRLATPYPGLERRWPTVVPVAGRDDEWRIHGDLTDLNRILGELLAAGLVISAFGPEESRLESEFRRAMGGVQ